jgi:hypothetical protein
MSAPTGSCACRTGLSAEFRGGTHFMQTLTHIKLLDVRIGLLINFNVIMLTDRIKRVANNFKETSAELCVHFSAYLCGKTHSLPHTHQTIVSCM